MTTDTVKFKSLADFLLGWTWDSRPSEFIQSLHLVDPQKHVAEVEKTAKADLRKTIINADRFRLSDDFLLRCMERANTSDPHVLLNTLELARLPFNRQLLVEFDADVACRKRIEQGTVQGDPIPEIIGRDGYLFVPTNEGDWWAIHVSDTEGGMPLWPVACYAHHSPFFTKKDIGGSAWEAFIASAWGLPKPIDDQHATFSAEKELLDRGVAMPEPFLSQHLYDLLGAYPHMKEIVRRMSKSLLFCATENAGSLRQASAILASLNCVPTTRVERRPNSKFQHRLRTLPNLSVTDVAIDARPGHTQAVYTNSFRTAIHHRLHDVRGHWRDFARHDEPFCEHEIVETDNVYALCGKCTRLLRWVVPHERGNENLGRVIHDHYTVQ